LNLLKKNNQIGVWASLAFAISLHLALPASAGPQPEAVVEDFHATLISAMQNDDFEARLSLLHSAVDSHFDVFTIARISLGRNWRELGEKERDAYQTLMSELIKTTYASRFDSFDNQRFETGDTQAIASNRLRIKTTLTTETEVVSLDYQLLNTNGDWRIYDVVANGVSDLSLKRANYASIFRDGGLEAVQVDIEQDIAENLSPDPT
jgi:phospholipid transport system substrate-binding protein